MLRYSTPRLEGEEDETHRTLMHQGNLSVTVGTIECLGTERAKRCGEIEQMLGSSEPIGWVRA